MYKGETSVENGKLVALIHAAEALQIKAMSGHLLEDRDQDAGEADSAAANGNDADDAPMIVPVTPGRSVLSTSTPRPQNYPGHMAMAAKSNVVLISQGSSTSAVNQHYVPGASYPLPPKKRKFLFNPSHAMATPAIESIAVVPYGNPNKPNPKPVDMLRLSSASASTSTTDGNSPYSGSGDDVPNSDEDRRRAAIIRNYLMTRSTGEVIDYSAAGVNANPGNQQYRSATATATRRMSMLGSSGSDEVQSPEGSSGGGTNGGGSGDQQRNLSGSDFWVGFHNYQQYEGIMNHLVPRDEAGDEGHGDGQQESGGSGMKRKYNSK